MHCVKNDDNFDSAWGIAFSKPSSNHQKEAQRVYERYRTPMDACIEPQNVPENNYQVLPLSIQLLDLKNYEFSISSLLTPILTENNDLS